MPTPLEWTNPANYVERAHRSVPGYGMVLCFIRSTPRPVSLGVFVAAVMLPDRVDYHEPEIISKRQSGATTTAKLFFQEFVDRIESNMQVTGPPPVSVPPSYVLTRQGQAIMCLSCGMESYSEEDRKRRFCGYCQKFLEQ